MAGDYESTKAWMKSAKERLDNLAPTEARDIADRALLTLASAIELLEEKEKTISRLRHGILGLKLGTKQAPNEPREKPGRKLYPRVWWDHESMDVWPIRSGLQMVQDNGGDLYEYDEKEDRLYLLSKDGERGGRAYEFNYVVDEWSPVVEVGEHVHKIRWFEDELDMNTSEPWQLPLATTPNGEIVRNLFDGDGDIWVRPYAKDYVWGMDGWEEDERKEDGYWSVQKIAKVTGSVMILYSARKFFEPVTFDKDEEAPHPTMRFVFNQTSNWYYRRNNDDTWTAPGVANKHVEVHGKPSITWEELQEHANQTAKLREHLS